MLGEWVRRIKGVRRPDYQSAGSDVQNFVLDPRHRNRRHPRFPSFLIATFAALPFHQFMWVSAAKSCVFSTANSKRQRSATRTGAVDALE